MSSGDQQPSRDIPPEIRACPYVGLRPFKEDQAEFFFGRETERRILLANVTTRAVTILFGPSGVGKSSLLLAGLVPDLRPRQQVEIVYFNRCQVPHHALVEQRSPRLAALEASVES